MTFLELCRRLAREVDASGSGPSAVTGQTGENRRIVDWVASAWQDIQLQRNINHSVVCVDGFARVKPNYLQVQCRDSGIGQRVGDSPGALPVPAVKLAPDARSIKPGMCSSVHDFFRRELLHRAGCE